MCLALLEDNVLRKLRKKCNLEFHLKVDNGLKYFNLSSISLGWLVIVFVIKDTFFSTLKQICLDQ